MEFRDSNGHLINEYGFLIYDPECSYCRDGFIKLAYMFGWNTHA